MSEMGHNSDGRLRAFVERIERLREEKKALAEDEKEIFLEATGVGYEAKIIRKALKLRAEDPNKRAEEEAKLDLYMRELGMV